MDDEMSLYGWIDVVGGWLYVWTDSCCPSGNLSIRQFIHSLFSSSLILLCMYYMHIYMYVGGSLDNVLRYHIWEQEACIKLCTLQSRRTGMLIETVTGVLDVKDMTLGQITRDFLGRWKLTEDDEDDDCAVL